MAGTADKVSGLSGATVTLCDNISSTKGEGTEVGGRNAISLDLSADVIEAPDYQSSDFTEKLPGLLDGSGSVDGYYEPSDTAQKEIINAYENQNLLGMKLWADDTHYAYVEVRVTGPTLDVPLEDVVSLPIDFEVAEKPTITTLFDG